jgi:hypothetical protein
MQKNSCDDPLFALFSPRSPHYIMILPFPADSAEYEEYVSVMNELTEIVEASTPDPQPEDV